MPCFTSSRGLPILQGMFSKTCQLFACATVLLPLVATAADVAYPVQLTHPAINKKQPASCTLSQQRDGEGLPVGYYMDVNSVVCAEKTCEVLAGRMFWDEIGRYRRYELPPGRHLTKKGHIAFTPAEYAHLDRLLRNRKSLLRDYAYEKQTAPESWDEEVAAITGATAQEIKAEVVDGAGYTCHTLWHWANGDVVREIRKLTGAALDTVLACRLLSGGDEEAMLFAVQNLASRKLYDARVVAAVRKTLPQAGATRLLSSLVYLSRGTKDSSVFYRDTADLFWQLDGRRKQTVLDFVESQPSPAPVFFDALIEGLPTLTEYYELHRVLALIEQHRHSSGRLIPQVAALLKHENFFIARRAYWFLEKRALGKEEKKAVDAFVKRYGDRL